jgi:tetratricopeptide (TPR) repeat protein
VQSYANDATPAVRDAMLAKNDTLWGTARFDDYASGASELRVLRLSGATTAKRKVYFDKLAKLLGRVKTIPGRPILYLLGVYDVRTSLTPEEINVLAEYFRPSAVPNYWRNGYYYDYIALALLPKLYPRGKKHDPLMLAMAPELWRVARDTGSSKVQKELIAVGQRLMNDEQYDQAVAWSKIGLGIGARSFPDDVRGALRVLQSRALSNIRGVIPVKRTDPRYPLFAAQANYNGGNIRGAWTAYRGGRDVLLEYFRELDPLFCTWLIDRNVELDNFEQAEALAREMVLDMESKTLRLPPEVRVRVYLSRANISFALPAIPIARAHYEQIIAEKDFDGLDGQIDAALRIAELDRVQKDYDGAIQRIEKVLRIDKPHARTEGHYHMALVMRDQTQFEEAKKQIQEVLINDASHVKAILLQGALDLDLMNLERAADLDLGLSERQKFVVPGKVLKVRVEDKLRRISKRTSSIEISIKADSGDEELFTLVPWADSLTRFEGSIETSLGAPNKGDRKLQLLGSDKVRYDFSDRFKKQHNVQRETEHELEVKSDSDLYASSGEILTGRDLEEQREEDMIRQRLQEDGRRLKKDDTLLSERRSGKQVKPGNQINVRVLDDDRCVSAGQDEVIISVSATSGDSIGVLTMTETNTHVGVFDGVIQTESAPATAFATDSDEGTDPNFPVSGGEYPAWVALPDNKRPKIYGVDMNDSVFMAKMQIDAGVPGRKLKDFFLQTSLNGVNFETIGSWPTPFKAWDGSPRGVVIRLGRKNALNLSGSGVNELNAIISDLPYIKRGNIGIETLRASWDESVFGYADKLRFNWDVKNKETWYLARFSAAFYTSTREHRTFTLKTRNGGEHEAEFMLAIDGELGASQSMESDISDATPSEYTGVFKKGAHRIDVFVIAPRRSKPGFEVHMDIEEAPYMALCPTEMFDTEKHPEIRRHIYREPAVVTPNEDGSAFEIVFGEGTRTRVVRLIMFDFETDAPAISRIRLQDIEGNKVLPTDQDLLALRKNKILEIIPGDRIKVTYEDPRHIGPNSKTREVFLSATFSNGRISPEMVLGYKQLADGRRMPVRARMLRYKPDDAIDIIIADPDGDVSRQRDSVEVTIRTTEGQVRKLTAVETEENTGLFEVRVFPVETEPQRDTEILVTESDDIVMEYMDTENTQPGIPWTRVASVEQVWYQEPELRSLSVTSMPITVTEEERAEALDQTRIDEYYPVTHEILGIRPESPEDPEMPQTYVIGGPLSVELTWPTIAQTVASRAQLFVQTGRGQAVYGISPTNDFDINVPGTIKLSGGYGTLGGGGSLPRGYRSARVIGTRYAGDPLDDGRFVFGIPIKLGKLPEESLAIEYEEESSIRKPASTLYINGLDTIHIGFRYTNDIGEVVWIRRDYELFADAFFDVMDRTYQLPVEGVYVDESVYFRVGDAMMDTSDGRDKVTIQVAARSGAQRDMALRETESHSGIFKGLARLVYAEEGKATETYHEGEMPVRFGDAVTAVYTPTNGRPGVTREIEVFKGSDGEVMPFTKRFTDPEMAVKTQLSIAEAYFEMAKKHRKLKQKDITRQEIAAGKKILEEALRDYPDSEARAQGDYLVANLSLELGEEIDGEEEKEERERYYNEALMRFTSLISLHRDSSYAPKAQFKKALTLERMGDFDAACEEYVKLSYRWPENELIAETIARLGQYFFRKGKQMQNVDDTDPVKVEMARLRSQKMFTSAAEVFGRLSERFPSHKLAEKTTVLSGQCYMRAENYPKAVTVLAKVIDKKDADKDVRAEAMYWCGDCYTKGKRFGNSKRPPMVQAYRMFKRVTWDYPASKWAKYARGRLTEKDVAGAGGDE